MRHLVVLAILLQSAASLAQQRPLATEPAETVERGHLQFEIGIEFLQDAVFPFSGLEGDLTRAGVFGVRLGSADNVEVQVLGIMQNILNVENRFPAPNTSQLDFSGNSSSDLGDFVMATKVRVKKESPGVPAVALRFGAELPNASNENGLGNDEANIFSSLLLEKHFGKLRFLSNVGVAILGDPVTAGSQDDLLTYGFAFIYAAHPRFDLLADIYGRAGAGGTGTEEQTLLRVGSQIRAAGLYWDAALLIGFRATDPSSGLLLGVSKDFEVPLLGN